MCEIEVEGPGETEDCEFEEDEPEATDDQEAQNVSVFAGIEEDAGAGEEDEGWGAEMRDPPGEEDFECGAAGGKTGVDADMIDGHDDHDGTADDIDGSDTGRGRGSGDDGSGGNGAHLKDPGDWRWNHIFDGDGNVSFTTRGG